MLPQILPFTFGDEPINAGEMTSVTCAVIKGDLPIEINWYLNEESIKSNERSFFISQTSKRTSMLNIESIHAKHAGAYKCVANNSAGFAEIKSILTVNGIYLTVTFVVKFDFP